MARKGYAPPGWQFTGKLYGVKAAVLALKAIGEKIKKKVIKKAITKGSQPLYKTARRLVPIDSKLLRKSLLYKVRVYRGSGLVLAYIGPRLGFAKLVRGKNRDPRYYAHIIHNGRAMVVPKKAGGKLRWMPKKGSKFVYARSSKAVAANPFLKRAFQLEKWKVQFIMIREIYLGVKAEKARLAAKAKSP